ncbi:preprotein translocase subunit SecE [Actibacterium lipolyticum]|uniref:Protein translocase subunit SecE n=1 Tax=Actibacterium lipolyticum TaxID=1524263 RepID=A0A238JJQ7_9RHOB|nr:preprotein translocase subunit SecE [Actibacterium lipolyticum]SMX30889.1 preprotein translocase subunit SecE [Actibacterium lipolyticum]
MAKANPLQFVQQTRSEISKVEWPTRREVMLTTVMVVALSAVMAILFSIVDLLIRTGLATVLGFFG